MLDVVLELFLYRHGAFYFFSWFFILKGAFGTAPLLNQTNSKAPKIEQKHNKTYSPTSIGRLSSDDHSTIDPSYTATSSRPSANNANAFHVAAMPPPQ